MSVIPMNSIKMVFMVLAGIAFASTPRMVQASQITCPNTGSLSVTGSDTNSLSPCDNSGTIDVKGTLTNTSSGTLNNNSGGHLTTTFTGSTIGTLTNAGTLTNNVGGTVFNDGTLINTGQLTNAGDWTGTRNSSLVNSTGGTLINNGTLTWSEGLHNGGTVINNGFLDYELGGNNDGLLINAGHMNNSGGVLTNNGTLTILTSGSLDLAAQNSVINTGTLTNYGSSSVGDTYTQTAGQTMNNGSMSGNSIAIQGGTLSGTGTITGDVTIESGATVSPGNSPGTLTMNGTFASSGNMLFEIGGLGSGHYDVLDIHGNAFFNGGATSFNFLNFSPVVGNSWGFLHADSITGWNNLDFLFSGPGTGQTAQFSFANGVETLRIVAAPVPEPSTLLLLGIALVGMAAWRWKRAA
jgi:hypothetical protein